MKRKRRSTKCSPKRVKRKIEQPKAIENPDSEQLIRCMEWIKTQKVEHTKKKKTSSKILNDDTVSPITENFDKVPTSTDSLAILKTLRNSDIKQGILYGCEWKSCKLEFEDEYQFHDHASSHINNLKPSNDLYHCSWDLCNFSTQCNSEISRHLYYHVYHTKLKTIGENISQLANIPRCTNDSKNRNVVPDLKSNYLCHWGTCNRTFLSMIFFCRHVHNHFLSLSDTIKFTKSSRSNKEIFCEWENCKMKFTVKYRLMEHLRKHTTEKVVGCYHCGAIFKTNTIFLDHCKRQPANNTQEYQCAQCFKYFASERLLRYHVLTHVNCFKCSMCDMTCNSAYGLARHVRYRHLSDRPMECLNCNKKFVSKPDLEQHIRSVHKKKVFECGEPECNFAAKSLSVLRRHDAEIHANNKIIYACHCCDNTYKCGTKLSKHLINFHKFQLPSGHQRFIYRMDEDGLYRLQTMRIESLEVTRQILSSPRTPKIDDYIEDSCSEYSESNKQCTDTNTPYKMIAIQDASSTDQFRFEYKDNDEDN